MKVLQKAITCGMACIPLTLLACGGGKPAGGGGAPDAGTVSPGSLPDPNPLNVQATFDAASAVTASIGGKGGSVSLTDANGTKFIFTIPPGILHADTSFTLAPLQTVSG